MLIGITMGDASGVGPELILGAYKQKAIQKDFIVIGDYEVLEYCNELLNYGVPLRRIADVTEVQEGYINVLDLKLLKKEELEIGRISKKSGYAAMKYVEYATQLALDKKIEAIVTLPMNKEATRLSNENFSGHTELIAKICGQTNYTMMLASEKLTVTHVNTHVSMEEAIKNVKKERIYNVIKLTHDALKRFIIKPKIAVAGLNPHAGEGGSFGREDINEIKPAVLKAQEEGIYAEGPIPPDTVFIKACKKQYDAVVCMYHDQGHIPIKLLDFEGGVNVTLGLKVIRTSVDHGTAFDIAYKGIASTRSLTEAYKFAINLVQGK
ncbi:MAG: 4-phospho-D-threonate 3-dehydrogenase / 4-phospho-D-erythronate 3-dehydrogenase [Petroclostridium sp.]|jgi:4-hydroxythreonine-4-phosphate dehydrogenase|uniref:4-hydroxythreonine-4-phosphate dehydrogenase PdxA n=1 Tax=Petroclostridium xylanilyticum TaxID=1792311 RepID=UPI000B98C2CD|nr:4-hydroxythreonine-4-phosphate dehydrogenase PdxA [Petroclostridium xylanilyticum]MBZ4645923.1 4-hydroxythreonine-4-phosphate dehydrogenase [Clostridia bacterium]MDK2811519.1 4-phospho-D-threonate 3-dehydrogenase / 4-phospho-D-erythronate 3-dehydrogenase [Petroclostridium sp.]